MTVVRFLHKRSILLLPILIVSVSSLRSDVGEMEDAKSGESHKTVIQSESLEMRSTPKRNYFYFQTNVRVEGNNLLLTCNNLEVTATRGGGGDDPNATIGEFGTIESIVATGDVEILQAGRRAEADRAQVLPHLGKVVLTENPRVYDVHGEVSGWRITLLKNERRVVVENNPEDGRQRPTVVLSELPDLGFESVENSDQAESEPVGSFQETATRPPDTQEIVEREVP